MNQHCAERRLLCRFVVKTTDKAGKKIFLNVCTSDKMALPSNWGDGQVGPTPPCMSCMLAMLHCKHAPHQVQRRRGSLLWPMSRLSDSACTQVTPENKAFLDKLARDGSVGPEEEAAKFPMAVSPMREDTDHLGQAASVCDVILNPHIIHQAHGFRHALSRSSHAVTGSCSCSSHAVLFKGMLCCNHVPFSHDRT